MGKSLVSCFFLTHSVYPGPCFVATAVKHLQTEINSVINKCVHQNQPLQITCQNVFLLSKVHRKRSTILKINKSHKKTTYTSIIMTVHAIANMHH